MLEIALPPRPVEAELPEVVFEAGAGLLYEAAGLFGGVLGQDEVATRWRALSLEARAWFVERARRMAGGSTPQELHEEWRAAKEAEGFVLGPDDAQARTHPGICPWEDLPPAQRALDEFLFIVLLEWVSTWRGLQPV